MSRKFSAFTLLLIISLSLQPLYALESAFTWEKVESGKCLVELSEPLPQMDELNIASLRNAGLDDLADDFTAAGVYSIRRLAGKFRPELLTVDFDSDMLVETAVELLSRNTVIKAVWPCPLVEMYELRMEADDFLSPAQWHIDAMFCPEAWAIYRGSSDIQIGIIDGGVNYEHPDLASTVWINAGEDLNGDGIIDLFDWNNYDDDGNGYIDDFWGWDWVSVAPILVWPGEDPGPPDNDPMDFDGHGTHCAGDASAATDNFEGVSAPGFKSQIMSLRAGYLDASGQGLVSLEAAIQAVYYAIDMDAEVLSMSFGGSGIYTPFRNALETAADSGLVLLAAAGNDNNNEIGYPAGYDDVIAVAATAVGDIKADFSSYGTWVTISAPGDQIYSTIVEGYGNMSGTSMSTPVAAGLAGLVKGLQPDWSSIEVGEWLAETADDIDYLNPAYAGQLGGGRINAWRAVDMFVTIDSLWAELPVDGERLPFNTEGALLVQYHKTSGQASVVSIELSSANPNVNISQNYYYIGDISQGESGTNEANPFLISVGHTGGDFEVVEIEAVITGDDFAYTQILELPVGRADVLIIDADQENDEKTSYYYEEALNGMGYSSEVFKLTQTNPAGDLPANHEAVIFFTGTAETNILSADDWDDLEDYFYGGGNLIISGQNIAEYCSVYHPGILQGFLWSEYIAPHSNDLTISGAEGNPLTEGMYLVMAGSGGAWNQSSLDVITPMLIAETFFVYDEDEPDEACGLYWRSSQGEMFFCSFGIEGINDNASTGNTKQEVLQMMFDKFGMTSVENTPAPIPLSIELLPPRPNPFNSTVDISFTLNRPGKVDIGVFDVLGREVGTVLHEHRPAGSYSVQWSPEDYTASGIYFLQFNSGDFSACQKVVLLK